MTKEETTEEDYNRKVRTDLDTAKAYIVITHNGEFNNSGGGVWGTVDQLAALYINLGARLYQAFGEKFAENLVVKEETNETNDNQTVGV